MLSSSSTIRPMAGSSISPSAIPQARWHAAMSRALSWVSQVNPSPAVCAAQDELHAADAPAVAERTQSEAEGGRRLALAGTGVDHQKTFCDGLGGNFGVLDLLAFGHLGPVTRGLVGVDLAHGVLRHSSLGGDRIP